MTQPTDSRTGATEKLARFVVDTRYEALAPEVVAAAKVGILDGIANMLAGSTQPLAAIAPELCSRRRRLDENR